MALDFDELLNTIETELKQETELVVAESSEVVPKDSPEEGLEKIETSLLRTGMELMDGIMAFADIDPMTDEVPPEWIEQLGLRKAERKFRLAKYALESGKEAAIGLTLTQKFVASTVQARNARQVTNHNTLNVAMIQLGAPAMNYPTLTVDSDD